MRVRRPLPSDPRRWRPCARDTLRDSGTPSPGADYLWTPDGGTTEVDRDLNRNLTYRSFFPKTTIRTVFMEPGRQPVALPPEADRISLEYYVWDGGIHRLDLANETLHRIADWTCSGHATNASEGHGPDGSMIIVFCEEWSADKSRKGPTDFVRYSVVIDPDRQRIIEVPMQLTHVSENYFVGNPPGDRNDVTSVVAIPRPKR